MSKLEYLLEGVEVEWKTLGEVADYKQPTLYLVSSKNYDDRYKTPVLTAGKTFILGYTDETNGIYKASINPVIIFDDFTTANKWVDFDFKAKSSAMKMIISKDDSQILLKYIYYWINTLPSGLIEGDHKRQWISTYANLQIPIQPLPIQKEIVRILDTFTELSAELSAELTARKKQYNYYREQLLSFEDGEVEWKTLGEVGEIKRGLAFTKSQAVFGEFPVVANSAEPICFHNEFNRNGEFIVVARSGANAGLISYWNEELFLTDAFSIHPNDSALNTKFAFYFLKKHQREIHLMKRGSGVPHIRASDFEIYKIPVPSLEEQNRIVSILDKFDTLTTSISEGLPKEIELRKKQYEYYRNQLLMFNGKL